MLPVADLAASAAFYRDLFGLDYVREFSIDGVVTGCSMGRPDLSFGLSLRRRDTIPGRADLREEHPLIWSVRSRGDLAAFRQHAQELGLQPTAGEHDDAAWVEVFDPDDIGVRVVFVTRGWTEFHGYEMRDGVPHHVSAPILVLS